MNEIYEKVIKPILPITFDKNDWYTLFITVIIFLVVYYITMKNRELLWTQIICISLLNLQMTTLGDYFLAMPPYDFYDTVDRNSGELMDIFLQNIVYPGTILFFMHCYKKFKPNDLFFVLISVSVLSILEFISVHYFELFTYKSWQFYYSIFFYLLVIFINLFLFKRLEKYLKKKRLT